MENHNDIVSLYNFTETELRMPLQTTLSILDLLHKKLVGNELRKMIVLAQEAIHTMTTAMETLHRYASIDSQLINYEAVDVLELINKLVYRYFYQQAQAKNLDIDIAMAKNFPKYINSEPMWLQQILEVIIGNAIKYTSVGSIKIFCEIVDDKIIIKIADSGCGIYVEQLAKLFFNYDVAPNHFNAGLKLSLCKKLMQKLAGDLIVDSSVGCGTTVSLILPLDVIAESDLTACKKVLLLEDDRLNRYTVEDLLTAYGYQVDSAATVEEALNLFHSKTYQIILSDIGLLESSGINFAKIVKAINKDQKMIAVTAHIHDEDKERCLEAGFDDIVEKPFRIEELLQSIFALV